MNLSEIQASWESDCNIDSIHLDTASLATPKLHSKYLNELNLVKMKTAQTTNELNRLKTERFRYYRGEMNREELTERGWEQWQGVKPMKSEMDQFLQGDELLIKLQLKLDYLKITEDTLTSILYQIKGRDWSIRNAIEFRKFISGT